MNRAVTVTDQGFEHEAGQKQAEMLTKDMRID